jgi:uncharacterized protein YggU (UPF0235/DUF167 family)
VLNWIVIIELCILATLGVMGLIGVLHIFCATFWREFLWPPVVLPGDPGTYRATGSRPSGKGRAKEETTDDAFYGRTQKSDKVDLNILVEPHAAADAVVGRDGDGIKIQVIGEAGESRSNKALIEMVANAVGVQPFQVTLTKGHYQTRTTVQLQGISTDELEMRLSALSDAE